MSGCQNQVLKYAIGTSVNSAALKTLECAESPINFSGLTASGRWRIHREAHGCFCHRLCQHTVMKADWRFSVKDYSRFSPTNLLFGVPRLRGPGRLKAEFQTLRRAVRIKGSRRELFRGNFADGVSLSTFLRFDQHCGAPVSDPACFRANCETRRVRDRRSGGGIQMHTRTAIRSASRG
jgi:hypothetical protein